MCPIPAMELRLLIRHQRARASRLRVSRFHASASVPEVCRKFTQMNSFYLPNVFSRQVRKLGAARLETRINIYAPMPRLCHHADLAGPARRVCYEKSVGRTRYVF